MEYFLSLWQRAWYVFLTFTIPPFFANVPFSAIRFFQYFHNSDITCQILPLFCHYYASSSYICKMNVKIR